MTDPRARSTGTHVDVENTSVGDLVGNISRDLITLLRQEIALAKVEVKGEAKRAGKAAGMLGGAGFAGYMVLLFLSLGLWWGLSNVMDQGWAALTVSGVWTVIGVVLYSVGRTEMREVKPKPEHTVDTVKQVPQALNPHEETA